MSGKRVGELTSKGKKALVILLKGPMVSTELAKVSGCSSASQMRQTFKAAGFVSVTERGLALTKKGRSAALKYSRDLSVMAGEPEKKAGKSAKTLEEIEDGDIISDQYGNSRKVLHVLKPGLFVVSFDSDHESALGIWTAKEAFEKGCSVKPKAQKPIDVTASEISGLLGYEVNVIEG